MAGNVSTHVDGYGIKALRSRHKQIRRLKRSHTPVWHGFRVWPSSWLLMDFIKFRGLPKGSCVLDVGCGWGLAGIYCAKNYGSSVTGVDIDSEVFPYLQLHADINMVKIAQMKKGVDELTEKQLEKFDVLIGTDICFWDRMVDPLEALIKRALAAGTKTVIIADPGRSPFEKLGRHFIYDGKGDVMDWVVNDPYHIQGRILKVSAPSC